MAESLLVRWGVKGSVEPEALLAASDGLTAWVAEQYPAPCGAASGRLRSG